MRAKTQDERFIIALYELSQESDKERFTISKYSVGEKISLHPRGVNAICKLLLQANFIKKSSEEEIYITENGASLAKRLLDE
ncbi:MAG TPA: hypothetical protein PLC42_02285 [Parachlamydiaceae bacterium]|nr:hypothetical protein [Parachlamydiaceae bacterium]